MQLEKQEIAQLYNFIHTANMTGIESVVVKDESLGLASGINESVCIIARSNIPKIKQPLGISKIALLKKRIDLLMSSGQDVIIDLKESPRGEISQIEMQVNKTKTQYRCSATSTIKAPKNISDGGYLGKFVFTKEQMPMILASIKVMESETIMLILKDDGTILFETADTNDKFTIELNDKLERDDSCDGDETGVFLFKGSLFNSLLKAAIGDSSSLEVALGISGTLQFILNGCEIYMLAHTTGEEE